MFEIVPTDFSLHRHIIEVGECEMYVDAGSVRPDDSDAIAKMGREAVIGLHEKIGQGNGVSFCATIEDESCGVCVRGFRQTG